MRGIYGNIIDKINSKLGIKLEIKFTTLLILILMYYCGYLPEYLIIFISMIFHEMGHIISAVLFKRKVYSVKISAVGMAVEIYDDSYDDICGKFNNIIINFAGPMVSLSIFFVAEYLKKFSVEYASFLAVSNFYLTMFNLIPVLPLDGAKIFRDVLAGFFGEFSAIFFIKKMSIFLSLCMIVAGIAQTIKNPYNFSLIFLGIFLLYSIRQGYHESLVTNIKNMMYKGSKILKRGIYPSRNLCVMKFVRLGELIKKMDFEKFHIIYVLDDGLSVVGILSENDVVEGTAMYGVNFSVGDFLDTLLQNRCDMV